MAILCIKKIFSACFFALFAYPYDTDTNPREILPAIFHIAAPRNCPMTANPLIGVLYHWLGGLASGSFYVPYRGVKKWSWEVYWMVGGVFSWILAPWAMALLMTQDVFGVLA